ncbi:MAG: hypothetical protein WCP03_00790 [Candidatus Saccharibacteria bacterium]
MKISEFIHSGLFAKLFVALLIILLLFTLYKIFGFGYIKVQNATNNSVITIDEVPYLDSEKTIKLHPGSYTINISSPEYNVTKQIKVSLFGTKSINATENKWDYSDALKSAIGTDQTVLKLTNNKLTNDIWYSGLYLTPNKPSRLFVIKFEDGQWLFVCENTYRECKASQIPESVLQHIESLAMSMAGD